MPTRTKMRLSDWEYKTVLVTNDAADLCTAGNQLFGWILIEVTPPPPGSIEKMLTFGRENTVAESPDMIRLSKRLDSYVRQINYLERLKNWAAFRFALIMSIIGFGMLRLSMRVYLFGCMGLSIAMFTFGVLYLAFSYYLYKFIRKRKVSEMNDLIVQKRKEIEELMKVVQQKQKNKV